MVSAPCSGGYAMRTAGTRWGVTESSMFLALPETPKTQGFIRAFTGLNSFAMHKIVLQGDHIVMQEDPIVLQVH